jgi:hypothetical protein
MRQTLIAGIRDYLMRVVGSVPMDLYITFQNINLQQILESTLTCQLEKVKFFHLFPLVRNLLSTGPPF